MKAVLATRHAAYTADMTTIRIALNDAANRLAKYDNAKLESEILLAHLLRKSRTWLHTWPERELNRELLTAFNTLIGRRLTGEPSAYITGEREFWSLTLEVTPDTLIPRAETELLVELALEHIPADRPCHVADLGTGCGAIALGLASERPDTVVAAVDRSTAALAVAMRNGKRLGLTNINFYHGSWFAPLAGKTFNIIVSNPPYVREDDPHLNTGDLPYEPRNALITSGDGLDAIREITAAAGGQLAPGGWLLVEHGYDQAAAVVAIFEQHNFHSVTSHHDLACQPRIVSGQHIGER